MTEIQKNISKKHSFSYSKDGASLSFELSEEVKIMKAFRSLLIEARKDLEKVISQIDK